MGTAFIDAKVRKISSEKQMIDPINSSRTAVKDKDRKDNLITQVDNMVKIGYAVESQRW